MEASVSLPIPLEPWTTREIYDISCRIHHTRYGNPDVVHLNPKLLGDVYHSVDNIINIKYIRAARYD